MNFADVLIDNHLLPSCVEAAAYGIFKTAVAKRVNIIQRHVGYTFI